MTLVGILPKCVDYELDAELFLEAMSAFSVCGRTSPKGLCISQQFCPSRDVERGLWKRGVYDVFHDRREPSPFGSIV